MIYSSGLRLSAVLFYSSLNKMYWNVFCPATRLPQALPCSRPRITWIYMVECEYNSKEKHYSFSCKNTKMVTVLLSPSWVVWPNAFQHFYIFWCLCSSSLGYLSSFLGCCSSSLFLRCSLYLHPCVCLPHPSRVVMFASHYASCFILKRSAVPCSL